MSNNILSQLLAENFQYLFSIKNFIYFKVFSDNISSIIKISTSNKSYIDNKISYILSELVLLNKTKNILLPIMNIQINISEIKNILSSIKLPKLFKKYLKQNELITISIREGFFNLTTLRLYIDENIINYKLLLLKIINTLEVIRYKYKYFRHNNFNLILYF